MLFGGHVRSVEDIDFLRNLQFDVGEVVLRNRETCEYWLRSGLRSLLGTNLLLIAHGPNEGPPNDIDNLWTKVMPALEDTINTCRSMGIRFLTIHLWSDPRFVGRDVLEQKVAALGDVVSYGMARGVRIGLENLSESAEDFERVLYAVPDLGITLDVGHGQLLTETNTAFGIIERVGESIAHLHLHDNHGGHRVQDDLHLPIGRGIVDFPRIIDALVGKGYEGTATLELEKEYLVSSREAVKRMIRSVQRKTT